MTHEELMDRMSFAELRRWAIMEHIEPYGARLAQIHTELFAFIAARLHNVTRDPNKSKPLAPADFMPWLEPQKPKVSSGAEEFAVWMAIKAEQDAILAAQAKRKVKPNGNSGPTATTGKAQ